MIMHLNIQSASAHYISLSPLPFQAESEQETSQRLRELTEQLEEVTRKKDLLAHEAERSATELHHLHAEVARLSGTSVGRATAELEEKVRDARTESDVLVSFCFW